MPFRRLLKKHQMIVLPLILVVIFDLCLLVANFVLSARLETISVNINIAGRQRMLSQEMLKALMLAHHHQQVGIDPADNLRELHWAVTTFDQTLRAFAVGGQMEDPSGQTLYLRPLQGTAIRQTLTKALAIWEPNAAIYKEAMLGQQLTGTWFDRATTGLARDNLQLLGLMNEVTNLLQRDARRDTYLLRGMQTLILLMILGSFALATLRVIRRERYYTSLMEKSTDLVVSVDIRSTDVTFISASCQQLLGHGEEFWLGESATRLFCEDSQRQFSRILDQIYKHKTLPESRCEMHLRGAGNQLIVADMVMSLSVSESGRADELHIDLRDISDRKVAELELKALAHKDVLTGLPNRTMLYELARRQIELCHRNNTRLAVLFMDLDGFKKVNDQYGHHVGDELLIEVGQRISRSLRKADCVARLGGDEFIVLLNSVKDEGHIIAVAEKLIEIISAPVLIGACVCEVSASIGVAIYPQHGLTIEALMRCADAAMYQVKHHGKAGVVVGAAEAGTAVADEAPRTG